MTVVKNLINVFAPVIANLCNVSLMQSLVFAPVIANLRNMSFMQSLLPVSQKQTVTRLLLESVNGFKIQVV